MTPSPPITPPTTPTTTPRVLTLRSPGGLSLTLMDWGATWLSCRVPMADGSSREVLLGCETPEDYAHQTAYLGATIGRYSNRIGGARFTCDDRERRLVPNPGSPHQLHGGPDGFDRRMWHVTALTDQSVTLAISSPHGDQGFPGQLDAQVTYGLIGDDIIEMVCVARVSAACPVCITNHAYFNLDGRDSDVRAHRLRIAADHYLPVDAENIPLGPLAHVEGSEFDFRSLRPLAVGASSPEAARPRTAYDHAYLLEPSCAGLNATAAQLLASDSRLRLDIATTLPALQLYTGQHLAGTPKRGGGSHVAHSGLALEPEFLPDSPNHPEWPQPTCWLAPGDTYRHSIRYRFSQG